MPSGVEMNKEWRYTLVLNNTDSELIVEYIATKYALGPKGYGVIRWKIPRNTGYLKFSTRDKELSPVFSSHDLYENKRIVILGDLVNSSSCRVTPRTDPIDDLMPSRLNVVLNWSFMDDQLRTMGELEKKVRIWHNQCKHLLKKYQEAVELVKRVGLEFVDFSERDLGTLFTDPTRVCLRHFPISPGWVLSSTLESSMLEGEALLLSCGEIPYNQAAFALTSVPPSVSTFSKFALAIRELSWIVDFLCCVIEGEVFSLDDWEWSEQRCRLVFSHSTNHLDASEDDSLEADVRRQNADREALRSFLDLKLSKSKGTSSSKFLNPATCFGWRAGALVQGAPVQGELESIWRKRLQASSCAPGSHSPLDAFVIDNPDTSFVQVPGSSSRNGTSKSVQECKWLGQTVALSTMSNIQKVCARAETLF